MSGKLSNSDVLKLVLDIDENGTRLTRGQIDFVANIIDSRQKQFSPREAERVQRLHEKKVVNGLPEYD